ncbi:uncharacterized protein BCR38DRAFT_343695 [Pseudomassariella vexata]|uniref:Tyrosinase copper-binding domain-containing protein n=1 Tax=Pseudomassariella vexata TaxID=1141098 RepID=A0A1Y2DYQ2_9PEZI|nr:uncharacterized protein BCR38DRAFT_343695 [Pseudomassariella vexata]ORY64440.1 hypothetical protein BCR38DRAFT_343695 [Pseudomassariella vexata]
MPLLSFFTWLLAIHAITVSAAYGDICTQENAIVRKEWSSLTLAERKAYIDAVLCMLSLPAITPDLPASDSLFADFAAVHINYTTTMHFDGLFFSWHRHHLFLFETALHEQCGYPAYLGLPYWHWPLYADRPLEESALFDGSEYSLGGNGEYLPEQGDIPTADGGTFPHGTGGGCVFTGPFANLNLNIMFLGFGFIPSGLPDNWTEPDPHCLDRDLNDLSLRTLLNQERIDTALSQPDIEGFQNWTDSYKAVYGMHEAGHVAVGMTMHDPFGSPQDPVFYLHHTGLDYLWNKWQSGGEGRRDQWNGTDRIFNEGGVEVSAASVMEFGFMGEPVTLDQVKNPTAGPYCYRYEEPCVE